MHTLIMNLPDQPPTEIDYRTIPNWMIPQLSFLRKRLGTIVTSYVLETDSAVIRAYLPSDDTYYLFSIHKADMRDANHVPPMFEVL